MTDVYLDRRKLRSEARTFGRRCEAALTVAKQVGDPAWKIAGLELAVRDAQAASDDHDRALREIVERDPVLRRAAAQGNDSYARTMASAGEKAAREDTRAAGDRERHTGYNPITAKSVREDASPCRVYIGDDTVGFRAYDTGTDTGPMDRYAVDRQVWDAIRERLEFMGIPLTADEEMTTTIGVATGLVYIDPDVRDIMPNQVCEIMRRVAVLSARLEDVCAATDDLSEPYFQDSMRWLLDADVPFLQ